MSDKKQSSVDFILNAFNLLSDSDFKAWMLNNHDKIKAIHKDETMKSFKDGFKDGFNYVDGKQWGYESEEQYYNETFGGDNE